MTEDALSDLVDRALAGLSAAVEGGQVFRKPPLEVMRYHSRVVRLSGIPVFGRALSVVAETRWGEDLRFEPDGCRTFLDRVGRAINARFRRFGASGGLAVGLTLVVIGPGSIRPEDEALLDSVLACPKRGRTVPLGWFQVDLEREAVAPALRRGPGGLFPEPEALMEVFTTELRRYVPPVLF